MSQGKSSSGRFIVKLIACLLSGSLGMVFLLMSAAVLLEPGGLKSGDARSVTIANRLVDAAIPGIIGFSLLAAMVSVARKKDEPVKPS